MREDLYPNRSISKGEPDDERG